jgi:probable rRNA maturation factor
MLLYPIYIQKSMIDFQYETPFQLSGEDVYRNWLTAVIASENREQGSISYIFCDDVYLHHINTKYLKHKTLTDIITFDHSQGNVLHADIFISIPRVTENAALFGASFETELKRVMAHGILHCCGYTDKTEAEKAVMREKEEEKMRLF